MIRKIINKYVKLDALELKNLEKQKRIIKEDLHKNTYDSEDEIERIASRRIQGIYKQHEIAMLMTMLFDDIQTGIEKICSIHCKSISEDGGLEEWIEYTEVRYKKQYKIFNEDDNLFFVYITVYEDDFVSARMDYWPYNKDDFDKFRTIDSPPKNWFHTNNKRLRVEMDMCKKIKEIISKFEEYHNVKVDKFCSHGTLEVYGMKVSKNSRVF